MKTMSNKLWVRNIIYIYINIDLLNIVIYTFNRNLLYNIGTNLFLEVNTSKIKTTKIIYISKIHFFT